jgi:cell division septum initiation protein DivIVA
MTEYITIQDFANKSGLSRQTVYRKLDSEWNKYYKEENGKKLISVEALGEVLKNKTEDDVSKKHVPELHMSLCDSLLEQLKIKDEQIRALTKAVLDSQNSETIKSLTLQLQAKDEQIKSLTEALKAEQNLSSQAHMLHAGTMQALPEKTKTTKKFFGLFRKNK